MALTIVQGNPIKVTGSPVATDKIIEPSQTGIYIGLLYWFKPTTAGHGVTLVTKNGKYIVQLECETDAISRELYLDIYVDNIYCSELDSGTLYIYTK